jgi:hypothetical protein
MISDTDRAWPARGERLYFTVAASLLALLAIIAFTPSFFLHGLFSRPAPTPYIAFHGIVMTGWMLLLAIQAMLVFWRRTSWHKALGYAGVGFAALIVPIGCMATLASAAREVHAQSRMLPFQLNVLGLELMQMLLFGSFVAAATILRARTDQHKRLMLLATLCIMPNAIVRLSLTPAFEFLNSNLVILHAWVLLAVCVAAIDGIRIRRLHPIYLWGIPLCAAALYLAWGLSRTVAWNQFWIRSLS